jgi:hypothetical protein
MKRLVTLLVLTALTAAPAGKYSSPTRPLHETLLHVRA